MTANGGRIPATIVTGFLGAGKTTLIRELLMRADGWRIALILYLCLVLLLHDSQCGGLPDIVCAALEGKAQNAEPLALKIAHEALGLRHHRLHRRPVHQGDTVANHGGRRCVKTT
jgi:hypothetical protein